MRPVDKGPAPRTDYTDYKQALPDLIERLGPYCSYCERRLEIGLAVEHVQPKSMEAALELEWINFLLGCVNCNSCKGKKEIELEKYLWPDVHNTFLAIEYTEGGVPRVSTDPRVSDRDQQRAGKLIELIGLDRRPGIPGKKPAKRDRRWYYRNETWNKAQQKLAAWRRNPSEELGDAIVDLAGQGYWSVWMTVFKDEPEMLRRFLEAEQMRGTARACFDAACRPLPREDASI